MPSISMCGSRSIKYRSLKVPGSDSSAVQTTYFGFGESFGTKLHFIPGGEPPPPAQRRFLHLVDHVVRRHAVENFLERFVTAVATIHIECARVFEMNSS